MEDCPFKIVPHSEQEKTHAKIIAKKNLDENEEVLHLKGKLFPLQEKYQTCEDENIIRETLESTLISLGKIFVREDLFFSPLTIILKLLASDKSGKDYLLIGLARFINHSCAPNCEVSPKLHYQYSTKPT